MNVRPENQKTRRSREASGSHNDTTVVCLGRECLNWRIRRQNGEHVRLHMSQHDPTIGFHSQVSQFQIGYKKGKPTSTAPTFSSYFDSPLCFVCSTRMPAFWKILICDSWWSFLLPEVIWFTILFWDLISSGIRECEKKEKRKKKKEHSCVIKFWSYRKLIDILW